MGMGMGTGTMAFISLDTVTGNPNSISSAVGVPLTEPLLLLLFPSLLVIDGISIVLLLFGWKFNGTAVFGIAPGSVVMAMQRRDTGRDIDIGVYIREQIKKHHKSKLTFKMRPKGQTAYGVEHKTVHESY